MIRIEENLLVILVFYGVYKDFELHRYLMLDILGIVKVLSEFIGTKLDSIPKSPKIPQKIYQTSKMNYIN
jgi:hypothetical protein